MGQPHLYEIAPLEANCVADVELGATQARKVRERCLVRIELDCRAGDPPVLGRAFGLRQELLGLELHDADAAQAVLAQIPVRRIATALRSNLIMDDYGTICPLARTAR
jgi:hypothetical protein